MDSVIAYFLPQKLFGKKTISLFKDIYDKNNYKNESSVILTKWFVWLKSDFYVILYSINHMSSFSLSITVLILTFNLRPFFEDMT